MADAADGGTAWLRGFLLRDIPGGSFYYARVYIMYAAFLLCEAEPSKIFFSSITLGLLSLATVFHGGR